ncbi:MAG: ShlB/FhaC/HecB family hemolysin secretion/activation protein [Proteobacteria bacterium]|nr:MAG: ShlB/FhaC/HecB family hemolysin secretion/activation protein [Pseudomonadota bacterium]
MSQSKQRMVITRHESLRLRDAILPVLIGASLIAGSVASNAYAQVTRLPGVIDRPVRDYVPDLTVEPKQRSKEASEPEIQLPADADEIVAKIDTIEFEGNDVLSSDYLGSVAAPYIGRELTKGDIARLKYDISKAYYDRGYVLVRVVTPPQSLDAGNLKVSIIEARIGDVSVDNTALNEGFASKLAGRLPVGEVFRESVVESRVSDITELSDVEASLTLKPGDEIGETDAVVTIREADETTQSVSIDNYGSELTGEIVARGDFQINNSLGRGEEIGIGVRASEEDLKSIYANLVMPTGFSNVKLELDALYSENEIGDVLEALNSSGESDRYGIALSKALTNTRAVKNTVRAGYERRKHESFLDDVKETEDNIRQAYLEFTSARRTGSRLVSYVSLKWLNGLGGSGADDIGEADASRATGDPEASIFRLNGYVGYYPAPRQTVSLSIFGQSTSDTLLSSDLFAIGGYGSVRGFPVAQEVGDDGYQASLQYSYLFGPSDGWQTRVGAFYDVGHVSSEIPGETIDDTLESAGLSVEVASPNRMTKMVFDWASPLGSYDGANIDDNTYYFRISQDF